ncbi:coiled-coil domain-containing protein 34 [Rhinophrynus dorsalis]
MPARPIVKRLKPSKLKVHKHFIWDHQQARSWGFTCVCTVGDWEPALKEMANKRNTSRKKVTKVPGTRKSKMSSASSVHLSEEVHSHSTPHGQAKKETGLRSKSYDLSSTGDSTYSLLSPIFHDSYENDEEESVHRSLTEESDIRKHRVDSRSEEERHRKTEELSLEDLNLTPWEAWLLLKEKQGRIELQRKICEELKQKEEKRKEQQKKEMKKSFAEEQHKEWVRKKEEQERKEKECRLQKERQEKESEEQRKMAAQAKSKEKYQEWLRKKKEEEQERKKKEKEQEEKRVMEQREKKEKANKMFEEWLEQAKNKPRPTLNSYGYVNGKLTGYYDGSSYPAPGFYNPIPWKPIPVPPPKDAAKNVSGKKKKRANSSQPYRSNLGSLYKPKDNLRVGGGMLKR